MWVTDSETLSFLEVNDAATARYGYTHQSSYRCESPTSAPEDIERLRQNMAARTERREVSREWRHRLKDGRIIYVDIISNQLEFAGRPAILVLAQDITERRSWISACATRPSTTR